MGVVDGIASFVGYGLMVSMVVMAGVVSYQVTQIGGQVVLTGAKNLGNKALSGV